MTVKFSEKNVSIFGKLQVTEGTAVNPADTDALAATTLDGVVNRETEAFEYLGDTLSRDEITTLKDTSGEVTVESFMPHLGTLDTNLSVANAPYSQWLQASGAAVTVDGTTGFVTATNAAVSNGLLTIDYHKASPEATGGKDKRWRFIDCRGMLDVTFEAGSRIKLGFKFLGNDSDPSMVTGKVPDFGGQKFNLAAPVRLVNMKNSTIKEILGTEAINTITGIVGADGGTTIDFSANHNLSVGETITVSSTTNFNESFVVLSITDADTLIAIQETSSLVQTFLVSADGTTLTNADGSSIVSTGNPVVAAEVAGSATKVKGIPKNMCVSGINATNFFGFNYDRFLLTCQEGFDKSATPTDVSVTILEDEVGGTDFDADANIEKFYEIDFRYGTTSGKIVKLFWSKVQLADVKDGKVSGFYGKDMTLRNIGKSSIIFQ